MSQIVYVLINQAMPGLVKIGLTTGRIEERMRSLDSTGVPLPFECFAAWTVEDAVKAEKALHTAFGDHRIRDRREFFRLSPDKPTAILKAFGIDDVTPRDDVVEDAEDSRALEKARARRPNFNFDMIGLETGTELQSVFDDDISCVVTDQKNVTFRGQVMSLSQSALIIARDSGRNWKSLAGPDYWKFEDQTLSDLRNQMEELV
ncbi:GIY-YIG nuclease family protein [Tateyamaria sp.]|uniref:GIY-YIG nuclease family protein n=1 Tax=Tateyamaria sp. TaxID=1929288 RepID=UPI00329E4960